MVLLQLTKKAIFILLLSILHAPILVHTIKFVQINSIFFENKMQKFKLNAPAITDKM